MPRRTKIPYPAGSDRMVDAVSVEISNASEPWCDYELSDGSVIRIKTIVSEIWRIENEFDANGNPVYYVKATNVLNVSPPGEITRTTN